MPAVAKVELGGVAARGAGGGRVGCEGPSLIVWGERCTALPLVGAASGGSATILSAALRSRHGGPAAATARRSVRRMGAPGSRGGTSRCLRTLRCASLAACGCLCGVECICVCCLQLPGASSSSGARHTFMRPAPYASGSWAPAPLASLDPWHRITAPNPGQPHPTPTVQLLPGEYSNEECPQFEFTGEWLRTVEEAPRPAADEGERCMSSRGALCRGEPPRENGTSCGRLAAGPCRPRGARKGSPPLAPPALL